MPRCQVTEKGVGVPTLVWAEDLSSPCKNSYQTAPLLSRTTNKAQYVHTSDVRISGATLVIISSDEPT